MAKYVKKRSVEMFWKEFSMVLSQHIVGGSVLYIRHRQTTSDICKRGTWDKYLQNSFCGSYRLTTYCEAVAPAASDLSKWGPLWELYSNSKKGFAMLLTGFWIWMNNKNKNELKLSAFCVTIMPITVITSYESRIK